MHIKRTVQMKRAERTNERMSEEEQETGCESVTTWMNENEATIFIADNFVVASLLDGVGKAIAIAIMGTIQFESLVLIFSQAENNLYLRYLTSSAFSVEY